MPIKDQWRDSIRPRIDTAQQALQAMDVADVVRRSGAILCNNRLEIALFSTPLQITLPGFEVCTTVGVSCREETQILVLDYLNRAKSERSSDGFQHSNRWIGFQELPDGTFYAKAFRSYTSDALLKTLDGDIDRFRYAADGFSGKPFSLGDAAAAFRALPNINLAVVWWAGDSEFPATSNVLFDSAAVNALPIDGMAALGRLLCQGLARFDAAKDA
jgi:Domain of unknown function (DUF3786)